MNRAATLALVCLRSRRPRPAKDLVGVFEDAVQNDPVIRQADANRLAAREARPQAWSALLPQLNGTRRHVHGDHNSGYQNRLFALPNPSNPWPADRTSAAPAGRRSTPPPGSGR